MSLGDAQSSGGQTMDLFKFWVLLCLMECRSTGHCKNRITIVFYGVTNDIGFVLLKPKTSKLVCRFQRKRKGKDIRTIVCVYVLKMRKLPCPMTGTTIHIPSLKNADTPPGAYPFWFSDESCTLVMYPRLKCQSYVVVITFLSQDISWNLQNSCRWLMHTQDAPLLSRLLSVTGWSMKGLIHGPERPIFSSRLFIEFHIWLQYTHTHTLVSE